MCQEKTEVSAQEVAAQCDWALFQISNGCSQEEALSLIYYFLKEATSEFSRSIVFLVAVSKQDSFQ